QRGPQGGFQPMGFPGFGAFKDGKLDLAALPEQTPQEVKDRLKSADKNEDGVLTLDELKDMPRPPFKFPEGKRPDFINEDNGINVEKVVAALKSADKNEDGVIDVEEQKAIGEYVRENYGPSFGFFINQIISEQSPFGFGAPGFGGRGFGGFGFGGFRGPQGGPQGGPEGSEPPQGDAPQPPQK
ncbi:MAG: hypothetical protein Q4G03_10945, partial [Planctomycetia bacterium]|nr:hypothetical protein [Planctomycetia bacterium]